MAAHISLHCATSLKKDRTISRSKPFSLLATPTREVSDCNQMPTATPDDLSRQPCTRLATVQQPKVTICYGYIMRVKATYSQSDHSSSATGIFWSPVND